MNGYALIRGDALHLPLADNTVDLIVTSPPYFALRSYQDDGEHYDGQIGSEPTPAEFLAALWAVTDECWRVLKPAGSCWINLGDSYAGSGGYNNSNIGADGRGPKSYRSNGRGIAGAIGAATWTVEDAAWLAGVIDSDGSISVREFVSSSGTPSFVVWVRIGQMRPEVVERARELTGVGRLYRDGRGVYNWHASSQMARYVLEHIWPWLCIKKRQALGAIALQNHVTNRNATGFRHLTADDIAFRQMARAAIQGWNRGIESEWEPPVPPTPRFPLAVSPSRPKSLNGLPWRFALGLTHPEPYRTATDPGDHPQWTLRSEVIWSKPNGLPESVTDRVRRSHEQWFHLTKQGRYFAAVDEVRERATEPWRSTGRIEGQGTDRAVVAGANQGFGLVGDKPREYNPLGKLPGSVWTIPSEPLVVPDHLGVDHFAAFPQELPRRIILGWSPSGICTACGEGRRPVVDKKLANVWHDKPVQSTKYDDMAAHRNGRLERDDPMMSTYGSTEATITGYACACPDASAPTRPAVVLDPFVGTGTVPMVARALGRYGVGVDLSRDYLRLADWRITSGHADKTINRTNRERQGALW